MTGRITLLPIVLLTMLGLSWGLRVSLIKLAAQSGIPHATVAIVTTLGVAACLSAIMQLSGRRFPINRQRLPYFLVCGLFGYAVPFFLQLYAAARVPAGTLALIFSMLPITTLILALLWRTDRVTGIGYLSIGIGVLSVAVLLGPEVYGSGFGATWGLLAALCVPVTYGFCYNYIAKRWPKGLDSVQVATGEVLIAIVLMLPLYLWSGATVPFAGSWGAGEVAILVMIGFWTLDTYLYFEIVRLAGPVFTSYANYIMLVSGVIWGSILFSERPTAAFWMSLALVVAALILLSWERVQQARKSG